MEPAQKYLFIPQSNCQKRFRHNLHSSLTPIDHGGQNTHPNQSEDWRNLHSKGLALYRLGRFDEALEIYDRVLALSTDAYDTLANRNS
jgi:tetratricopeptide (TPR) repeat protein